MMIEFDEYKVKLNGLKPKLDELAASLGIERCKEDIERLHAQIESPAAGRGEGRAVRKNVQPLGRSHDDLRDGH